MNIFRYENSYTKRRFELNGYERTKDFEVTVEEEVGLPEEAPEWEKLLGMTRYKELEMKLFKDFFEAERFYKKCLSDY